MNKKILCFGIISMFIFTGILNASAEYICTTKKPVFQNIIYVDDDNTDGPWEGTIDYPYQHIQNGVDNASSTEMVYVCSGTYSSVRIYRPITLRGENKETTIIDCNSPGEGIAVYVLAREVTISGFTITNACDAIYLGDFCNECTISDNIMTTQNCSVKFWHSSNNKVIKNTMSSEWVDMYIYCSCGNTIRDNTISNSRYGMHLYESHYNIIAGNVISNHFVGINIVSSNGYNKMALRISNIFKDNYDDIAGLPKGKVISAIFSINQLVHRFPILAYLINIGF